MTGPLHVDQLAAVVALDQVIFGDEAWSEQSWWAELEPGHVVLARWDDSGERSDVGGEQRLWGVIALSVAGDSADLLRVMVAPPYRRRGVARQLILDGIEQIVALGAHRVLLEVEATNTSARTLYDQLGWAVIDRRRDYYGPGRAALVMARSLSPVWSGDIPLTEAVAHG